MFVQSREELVISYVHEQDHLGFRMLTVETAAAQCSSCI